MNVLYKFDDEIAKVAVGLSGKSKFLKNLLPKCYLHLSPYIYVNKSLKSLKFNIDSIVH